MRLSQPSIGLTNSGGILARLLACGLGSVLAVVALSLQPSTALAQPSANLVPGYGLKRWTTAQGLPHNWITAIVQTSDGYLWLGTKNAGLVRFDGIRLDTFNLLNTPALESDEITALHEDADGTLWIGTGEGLVRYRQGRFDPEKLGAVLSSERIIHLGPDHQGRLVVAGVGEILRRDAQSWSLVFDDPEIWRVWSSPDGTLWAATRAGLVEWRDRIVRRLTEDDGLPAGQVLSLLEDRERRLWVGTTTGLAYLDRKSGAAAFQRVLPAGHVASSLYEDREGVLWIGGVDRVVRRDPDGTLIESPFRRDAPALRAAAITEDREGNVWIGVEGWQGGLYRLTRQSVTTLVNDRLPCQNIGPVAEATDGTIWLATFCDDGRGVFSIRKGQVVAHDGPAFVTALLAEPDGTVWAGTYRGGVYRFDGRRFEKIDAPVEYRAFVSSFLRDPDGTLWVATTTQGLLRWREGEWTSIQVKDGLASNDVRSLASGHDGAIWIGMNGGVSRYQDGHVTTYSIEDGVPRGQIRALHVDADGVVWIGAYGGGLARLRDGVLTPFGVHDGLLDSSVHRILEDDSGFLWLSSDRGVRRVAKADLNAVADGRGTALHVRLFNEADGMRSAECNGIGQPAGWRLRDGTFQFPTQGGVVRINPSTLEPIATNPIPLISGLTVDRVVRPLAEEIVVAPGRREIEIAFTAPSFARPETVQFRYRLEGYSEEWIEIGTRRTVSFAGLQPGRYRFVVQARDGGEWSKPTAAVTMMLRPFFYQRWTFQVAVAALLLAGAGAAARTYVVSARRRALALERAVAERTSELSSAHERLSAATVSLEGAKRQVEQAHEQVLAVLNQLDVAVLMLDETGVVRYASPSAQRLLQKDSSELIGQRWSAALPLSEADRVKVGARVDAPASSGGRISVQVVVEGTQYWTEIDVREEPPPGRGRILYLYGATELAMLVPVDRASGDGLVGRSSAMQVVYKQIRDVARVDCTVLIEGETGVGKELVARAIHRGTHRAGKPFIPVNVAGLSESLLASQLFGHRKGAFTGAVNDQIGFFEAADGGTLFLDEVGDMPVSVQASLLRVLQEREITRLGESHARRVDVRFLAATHRDLAREVEEGRFREDLYYRIRVATIFVPPLRDRLDDIPLLVEAFLLQAARKQGRPVPHVTREAIEALMRYRWPGNVRELRAVLESAHVGARDNVIRVEDLRPEIVRRRSADAPRREQVPVATSERERIVAALRQTGGNRKEAARLLGIGRTTLYRRLVEYRLDDEPEA